MIADDGVKYIGKRRHTSFSFEVERSRTSMLRLWVGIQAHRYLRARFDRILW